LVMSFLKTVSDWTLGISDSFCAQGAKCVVLLSPYLPI
jgi:hypothetical protein